MLAIQFCNRRKVQQCLGSNPHEEERSEIYTGSHCSIFSLARCHVPWGNLYTVYVVGASNNVAARRTLISPDKIKNNSLNADPFHEALAIPPLWAVLKSLFKTRLLRVWLCCLSTRT